MKKKILFTLAHLEFSNGVCNVLLKLCNSLDKDKYEITVMPLYRCDAKFASRFDSHINIKKAWGFYFKGFNKIVRVLPQKLMYKLFVKEKYDVEIAFQRSFSTSIIGASTNRDAKHIAWMHGYDEKDLKWHENFDLVIACAKSTAEKYKAVFKYPERVGYLYNLVDENEVISKSAEPVSIVNKTGFTFCTVGRLSPEKGFMRLLQCHKRLIDEGLSHNLWIVGEGAERRNLETYISKNHLQNSVFLAGFDVNPYKYMARADMFVCSSFREGMSTVCVEALLLGKSVLTTEVNGARELVHDNGCGIMVDNDTESLYEGMKYVLLNKDRIPEFESRIKDMDDLRYSDRKKSVENFFDSI